mmetsp:Transcript_28328/g.43406  ORF Transcript_28328/g.43406 Transcript_28328/m.43406 type:complete len:84 (-) Transcript_28328:891-1142(-)
MLKQVSLQCGLANFMQQFETIGSERRSEISKIDVCDKRKKAEVWVCDVVLVLFQCKRPFCPKDEGEKQRYSYGKLCNPALCWR